MSYRFNSNSKGIM